MYYLMGTMRGVSFRFLRCHLQRLLGVCVCAQRNTANKSPAARRLHSLWM